MWFSLSFGQWDFPSSPQNREFIKRVQTRSQKIIPLQQFPLPQNVWEDFVNQNLFTPADSYFFSTSFPRYDKTLLSYSGKNSLKFSPVFELSLEDTSEFVVSPSVGGLLFGTVGKNLSLYSRASVRVDLATQNMYHHQFDPSQGETCSVSVDGTRDLQAERTCATFESYFIWNWQWLSLKTGRDKIHMGPGYFSSLTAGDHTAPYFLLDARVDFAPWLHHNNMILRMVDSNYDVQKYLHIHRFEFKPSRAWHIAFQDMVIYQERDIEASYILPLVPLAFLEDNTGGRDNDALSLDVSFSGIRNFSLWGEIFIDDLQDVTSIFSSFWENRWAGLVGFQLTSPWLSQDFDIVVEYHRIEPWTYNGRQAYTSFRHFDKPSANIYGPNSQSLNTKISYRPVKWIELGEHFEFSEKGTDRGSKIGEIHDRQGFDDPEKKEWLGGYTIDFQRIVHSLKINYGYRYHFNLWYSQGLNIENEFGLTFGIVL